MILAHRHRVGLGLLKGIYFLFLSVLMTGCGGGGDASPQQTPGKKAIIGYSVTTTGIDPVSSLQFRYVLPTGSTVSTISGSNEIDPVNLVAGATHSGVQLYGSYSAPLVVRLSVAAKDSNALINGFGPGALFKLTCDLPSTSTLTVKDFTAQTLNNISAYWYSATSRSSILANGVGVTVTAEISK
jgi:hypothetical protein